MRTRNLTRIQQLQRQWRRLVATPLVIWDVGAVTTRVSVGQRFVFSQATCLVINQRNNQAVAYGDAAYRLLGNSGRNLSIIFPVDRGCLTDKTACSTWLEYIRGELWPRRRWLAGLRAPKGVLCLGESVGVADVAVWKDTLEKAGLASTSVIPGLIGLSWYLDLATADEPCFVLDMGGSQTQVGIITRGTIFRSSTLGWGGIELTTMIQTWFLREYHCQISWRAAEELKRNHGSLTQSSKVKKIAVRGKDPYTQLGMTATVELSSLQEMLVAAQKELVLFIRQFLASVPADVATDCLENGLWVAGGAAQLDGLERWLSTTLATPVSLVSDPTNAATKGIAIWAASRVARHEKL